MSGQTNAMGTQAKKGNQEEGDLIIEASAGPHKTGQHQTQ
jgi:hypothetical protein